MRIPIDWGVVVPILIVAAIIGIAWANSDAVCVKMPDGSLKDVNYTGKPCR